MIDWTRLPDPATLMIYAILAVLATWAVLLAVGTLVLNRRDRIRWAREDAKIQASLDAALREMDRHALSAKADSLQVARMSPPRSTGAHTRPDLPDLHGTPHDTPGERASPRDEDGAPAREKPTPLTETVPHGTPALADKVRDHPRQETDKPVSGGSQPPVIPRSVALGCTVHHQQGYGQGGAYPGQRTVKDRWESAHCGAAPFLCQPKQAVSWRAFDEQRTN